MLDYSSLKQKIKESGMTVKEFTEKCGLTDKSVSSIINKHKGIRTDTLNIFCKVLKCNVGDIVKITNEEKKERINVFVNWDYLEQCCKEKGYTFIPMSLKIGRSKNYLKQRQLVNGNIDSEDLIKICNLIGYSAEEFLSD